MITLEQVEALNEILLKELPHYREEASRVPPSLAERRRLLRGLMNVRPPMTLSEEFLQRQDALLGAERAARDTVEADALPGTRLDSRLSVWQGDIVRLRADAIVNAANASLLGCFVPCHNCIDNAIHSAAGLQLRAACSRQMRGHEEPAGSARITEGYNLSARYVLHTVGPIVDGAPTQEDRDTLASCYRSCLALAAEHGLHCVAFCCISTGVFCFPRAEAAEIAVREVRRFLDRAKCSMHVVFNVFEDRDFSLYRALLGPDLQG